MSQPTLTRALIQGRRQVELGQRNAVLETHKLELERQLLHLTKMKDADTGTHDAKVRVNEPESKSK